MPATGRTFPSQPGRSRCGDEVTISDRGPCGGQVPNHEERWEERRLETDMAASLVRRPPIVGSGDDEEAWFRRRHGTQRAGGACEGPQADRLGCVCVGEDSGDDRERPGSHEDVGDLAELRLGSRNTRNRDASFQFIEHCDVIGHGDLLWSLSNVSQLDHRV